MIAIHELPDIFEHILREFKTRGGQDNRFHYEKLVEYLTQRGYKVPKEYLEYERVKV